MAIPAGFGFNGGVGEGFFSFIRRVTIGTDWENVNIRSSTLANAPDIVAQLTAAGLTPAAMQDRALLRSARIMSLDADDVYITEAGVAGTTNTTPPNTLLVAPGGGAGVSRYYPPQRELTVFQIAAEGASVLANLEVTFDIPPAV